MKKTLRIVGIALAALVVVLLLLPLWIGPVATTAVNALAPKLAGTRVEMSGFGLNPYTGHLSVRGFRVWNPAGYDEAMALDLAELDVRVSPLTLLSDVLRVKEVRVNGLFASYLGTERAGLAGEKNVDRLALNVLGPSYTNETAAAAPAEEPAAPAEPGFLETHKLIIDLVDLSGIRVRIGPLSTSVPVPKITDIGLSSGGVSWKCAGEEIWAKFLNSMGAAGGSLKGFGKDGLELGQKGLSDALEAAKGLDVKGAQQSLRDTGKKLESLGKELKGLFK